ncbi:MAG: hypothetical protein NVSMB46_07020 [Candidatus Saccharimonadales bacterium]
MVEPLDSSDYDTTIRARSIELAERAYRLQSHAISSEVADKLNSAGDELIHLDNPDRFYTSQSILETDGVWTEDQRSLAHELNVVDQQIHSERNLTLNEALTVLANWANTCTKNDKPEVRQFGSTINANVQMLAQEISSQDRKTALNGLIEIIEHLLKNAHIANKPGTTDDRIKQLRALRDVLLIQREVSSDINELLLEDQNQKQQIDRVSYARDILDEIYKTINPTPSTDDQKIDTL